jgi:hypothetical protein
MDNDGADDGGSLISLMDEKTAANPQPLFKVLRETTPVIPIEGLGVMVTRKAEADEIFRHPEIFSSNADAVDLKNLRPLIPLQIDPPEHKKYRKLLDPIFAPPPDGSDRGLGHPDRQRTDRRVHRPWGGRLRQRVLDPVPLPGLSGPAGPVLRRAAALFGHEERDHPAPPGRGGRVRGARRHRIINSSPRTRSTSTSTRSSTGGRNDGRKTCSAGSSMQRSTATSSPARTSSTSASSSSSPGWTR